MSVIAALFSSSDMQNPANWLTEWAGGRISKAGVAVTPQIALSVSSIFACVRNLAEDTAKLPLPVYEEQPDGSRKKLKDDPLYRVLNWEANPEMTAFSARQAIGGCAALYGTGYGHIIKTPSTNKVKELIPLHPSRVTVSREKNGQLLYKVTNEDGTPFAGLRQDDLFVLPGFSQTGILGEMIARTGKDMVGLCIAADTFASTFFGNGTNVEGVLSHPKSPDIEQRANIRKSISEEHKGVDESNKIMLIWDGMTFVPTRIDPNKAQALQARQFNVEECARWFRMPPHKIGHLLRAAGWSTLEATNQDYLTDTLMPWLIRWEQEGKRKLIRPSQKNVYIEHMFDAMLRPDAKTRAEVHEVQLRSGHLTLNEWAQQENKPLPGGKLGRTRWMMTNVSPAEKLLAPEPEIPTSTVAQSQEAVFEAAASTLLRKETNAAKRAARKHEGNPAEFKAWVMQFYKEQAEYFIKTMAIPIQAIAMLTAKDVDTKELSFQYAIQHINVSKCELIEAIDRGFIGAVDHTCEKWLAERPALIARQLISEVLNAR